MGRHARLKKSRVRPVAAVLTAATAAAGTVAAAVTPASAATTEGGTSPSVSQAAVAQGLLRPGTVLTTHQSADPQTYTVKAGDNLSDIAAKLCGQANDWLGIWHATHGIFDPNVIEPGQVLTVACNSRGPGYNPPVLTSYQQPADPPAQSSYQAPVQQPTYQQPTYQASGTIGDASGPGGSFGACVVARESGGQSQVMNATGHYGLYQFAAATWAAYGGNPASFGNASVAEQEQVFSNALAKGGESNWSAYDGC